MKSSLRPAVVAQIADGIPLGQPILVGHHSEKHARRDAERIENGMRRAVRMWETAQYWKSRAAGAIRAAKYKERPDVRHRRIKTLEADKRKQERAIAEAERFTTLWQREGLNQEQAEGIANFDHVTVHEDGKNWGTSLWSMLHDGKMAPDQAAHTAIAVHQRTIAHAIRWIEHLTNRLEYKRAMLGDAGGPAAERFPVAVGGRVLIGSEWLVVLRVNKACGAINSVTTNARYVPVTGIEEVRDYRAPDPADAAKVKAATKLPPLVNFPGEGFQSMTKAEWERKPKEYKGTRVAQANDKHAAYRYRTAFVSGSYSTAPVFITDAKRVDPPPPTKEERVQFEVRQEVRQPRQHVTAEPNEYDAMKDQLWAGVQVVTVPQLFPRPEDVAKRMVQAADIRPGDRVLEPNAGTGAILRELVKEPQAQVVAVEINGPLADTLRHMYHGQPGLTVRHRDFLECHEDLGEFDAIVMSPPFANAQDIDHIEHALTMLKPGGRLVALCANGPRQQERLRPLIEARGGLWEELSADTFRNAGTSVRTVLLVVEWRQ